MNKLGRHIFCLIALTIFAPVTKASTVNLDTVYVSTIGGQPSSNGISVSSPVFFVSGASLTVQGSGGYITTGSSVSASAFFGDGSRLDGNILLGSTQTIIQAATFTSSFTVQSGGRQIVLSTSASANNISISNSGIVSFSQELHNSSSTVIPPGYTTTNTSFGPCVTGSTITIATTGGMVEVVFVGAISSATALTPFAISFLQDGRFPPNFTSNIGAAYYNPNFGPADISEETISFSYLLPAPSAGTHSYCITLENIVNANPTTLANDTNVGNLFYVMELK